MVFQPPARFNRGDRRAGDPAGGLLPDRQIASNERTIRPNPPDSPPDRSGLAAAAAGGVLSRPCLCGLALLVDALAILGCGVLVLDTAARYRQYRVLRMALRQANGVTGQARRLFRRARSTWCTRRAALAAAHAEGFGREARALVCR